MTTMAVSKASFTVGDLTYINSERPPAKLAKALAVVATIHDEFKKEAWMRDGASYESCVLCALTVRDFFWSIGYKDARVRSVCAIVKAEKDGEQLHSLGVGSPHDREVIPGKWAGHLVTEVGGFLIDATMYPWKRPAWPELPPMVALRMVPEDNSHQIPDGNMTGIGGCHFAAEDGRRIELLYFDRSENKSWRDSNKGGDCLKKRRANVVKRLRKKFGAWRE